MTTTGPIPRVILQDRWNSVMELERTGGDASEQHLDLVIVLGKLIDVVAGWDADESLANFPSTVSVLDSEVLAAVGKVVIDRVEQLGIAR